MRIVFGALVAALFLLLAARADVVHLRDGRTIEGETRHTPAGLEVSIKHGQIVIPHEDVLKVDVRETASQTYARLLEALGANDVEGLLELIEHCVAHGLAAEARPLLEETRLLAPDAPRLHAAYLALDFHLEGKDWVPPEVWYPRQGWVRDRGRWLSPEQARLVRASRDLRGLREEHQARGRALRGAERDVEVAEDALRARERAVLEAQAFEAALPGRIAAAQEALRAREGDLAFAREQALFARQRYELWCASPCACAQTGCAWELRRGTLYQDLVRCDGRVPSAERARDEALGALQALHLAQSELPARLAAVRLRALEAEQALTAVRTALALAQVDLDQAAADLERAEREREAARAGAPRPR